MRMFFVIVIMMMVMLMSVLVLFMVMVVFMLVFVVVLVGMFMHVLIFFNTMDRNVCVGAFDTALDALFEFICDIGNANGIKLFLTGFNVARKLSQRCEEHVSCSAHIAFDIKSLHGLTSDVVDHAGRIARTESVVDINDRDTARARIEHA